MGRVILNTVYDHFPMLRRCGRWSLAFLTTNQPEAEWRFPPFKCQFCSAMSSLEDVAIWLQQQNKKANVKKTNRKLRKTINIWGLLSVLKSILFADKDYFDNFWPYLTNAKTICLIGWLEQQMQHLKLVVINTSQRQFKKCNAWKAWFWEVCNKNAPMDPYGLPTLGFPPTQHIPCHTLYQGKAWMVTHTCTL